MKPQNLVAPQTRLVLFMTTHRPSDIPGIDNPLACLLPLGSATFVERVMESCALTGLSHIDVVASDHPESLRAALGDGEAWGLKLTWHLAKDPVAPYKVLSSLNFADDDLIVIGHAHQWVSERLISTLQQRPGAAMHVGHAVFWTGWYSDTAKNIARLDSYVDFAAMTRSVAFLTIPGVLAQPHEYASVGSAAGLFEAQKRGFEDPAYSAPASWSRMPWGAMSPDATVSAAATIVGPVLIGPGCVVDSSAQIGPNVLLSRDVFISGGAEVRNSVVLPNTYVDGRVTLDHVVVQGNSVQNLKWNVGTVLAKEDAMLTPLFGTTASRTPVSSRMLGALLAVILLPWFFLLAGLQCVLQKPMLWRNARVVKSRNLETGELHMTTIREAYSDGWLQTSVGFYGAVVDVIQGRRNWFGLRPRNTSAWYALSRDWQNLFSRTMLGVFHAPSWSETKSLADSESLAAADAFMAVHSTCRYRFGLLAKWRFAARPSIQCEG